MSDIRHKISMLKRYNKNRKTVKLGCFLFWFLVTCRDIEKYLFPFKFLKKINNFGIDIHGKLT